jgi:hypothetical protein
MPLFGCLIASCHYRGWHPIRRLLPSRLMSTCAVDASAADILVKLRIVVLNVEDCRLAVFLLITLC